MSNLPPIKFKPKIPIKRMRDILHLDIDPLADKEIENRILLAFLVGFTEGYSQKEDEILDEEYDKIGV